MSALPIETRIIAKVIEDKDFHSLEKAQITEGFFYIEENKAVFKYIRDVYYNPQTLGMVPSRELISERFPSFYFPPGVTDPVSILAVELRTERVRTEILSLAQRIVDEADADPLKAKSILLAKATEISSMGEVGEDLSISTAYNVLLNNYEAVQNSGGVVGIPYPWQILNAATQGKKGGDFIVLYGRPKSMKSFLALYMATHDYLVARRRVLFFTMEMSPFLVAQRVSAMITSVDYDSFKKGKLAPEDKDKAFSILKGLLDDEKYAGMGTNGTMPAFSIVSSKGAAGRAGVSWLRSKVRDLKPHIVYVDGMYLMKDDRSNQRTMDHKSIGQISQDLKLLAQEYEIPVVAVTQANRNAQASVGDDLTELSFSDSLGQDADAVFRVSKQPRMDESGLMHEELWVTAPGLREGKFEGMVVGGYPCHDFGFRRALTGVDKEIATAKGSAGAPKQQKPVAPTYKSTLIDPKIAVNKK